MNTAKMSAWSRKSNAVVIDTARSVECAEGVKANDKIWLCFERGGGLHVHKSALSLASSVFNDLLDTDPAVEGIKVDGGAWEWDECLMRIYPIGASKIKPWTMEEVLRVLPIAHKYNISAVVDDAVAYAASFTYNSSSAITFLELSSRLQVDELSRGPIRRILEAAKRLASAREGYSEYPRTYARVGALQHGKADDAKLFADLKDVQGLSPSLQIMLQELGVVFSMPN